MIRNRFLFALACLAATSAACGTDDSGADELDDAGADTAEDGSGSADDVAAPDTVLPDVDGTDAGQPDVDASFDAIGDTDGSDVSIGPVTYHGDVRAMLESKCLSCHTYGGLAGLPLDSWAAVEPMSASIVDATESGRMPPWLPSADCHPLQGDRSLDATQIATLVAWREQGFPEGDPSEYVAPEAPESPVMGEADIVTSAGFAFTPDRALPDDYHCFVLDAEFETDTFLNATDIFPDQRAMVHHVLLYLVEPDQIGRLNELNADGRGYTCFGGPEAGSSTTLAGWVPGAVPIRYPENSGILVPAGSKIVMQIHYNTAAVPRDQDLPADQTSAAFWTLPAGATPERLISIIPVAHTGIRIPAGEPEDVETLVYPVPIVATLIGVAPHMHTLGSKLNVTIDRGDEAMCAVDIQEWDFGWQQFYRYPDDEPIHLLPGDSITLTCTYDNSEFNQPIVNGERLEPRDVRWGESTFDEMCLNYLILAQPYYPDDGTICGGFEQCYDDCPESDSGCFLSCTANGMQFDCAGCVLGDGGRQCVTEYCQRDAGPFFGCVLGCDYEYECIFSECLEEFDTLHDCLEPHIRTGDCDSHYTECGIEMAED